eukprot:13080039-Alexandrium_andersonii.AAC.1
MELRQGPTATSARLPRRARAELSHAVHSRGHPAIWPAREREPRRRPSAARPGALRGTRAPSR